MSQSLIFKADYFKTNLAVDEVEKATWASLEVSIGSRNVTHVIDNKTGEERTSVNVPVFPVAEWIVDNWWSLLNEPSPTETVPEIVDTKEHLPWIRRHCWRTADSALLLPRLYLFNDGRGITAAWDGDEEGDLPHMPGRFIEEGRYFLSQQEVADALTAFVSNVIGRVGHIKDERVMELMSQWQSILTADHDEAAFCIIAGRMGLNPYDIEEVTNEIAETICSISADPNLPIIRDLTECTAPELIAEQFSWVDNASRDLNLGPMPDSVTIDTPQITNRTLKRPYEYGYSVAQSFRQLAGLKDADPVVSVESAAKQIADRYLNFEVRNHLPGERIRGAVGWTNDDVVMTGPGAVRDEDQRFLLARGLFHAFCSCKDSQRLMSEAHTWSQQAARGFAAEFLAPRQALKVKAGHVKNPETVENLAVRYNVNRRVIENQLSNAGVEVYY